MKTILFILLLALAIPLAWTAAQPEASPVRVTISGVNASQFPRVIATVNVTDALGQPLLGLGLPDFEVGGTFGAQAALTSVVNITDDDLPFATVLAIDVSDSMSGTPLARAKEAALAFIDGLRPDDPVAIVVFGNFAQVVQDFTTDRERLRIAIDALAPVGQTALYQGAYEAVRLADQSLLPRRAVILLGDGAEFGERSRVTREAALAEAINRGVPVYTVGLGFGADRTYLEELSNGTNAQFFESPTPDALQNIYRDLAARFRSQYVLTIDAFLPGDGTVYTLDITARTPQGGGTTEALFRAPIPVPIVRFSGLPTGSVVAPLNVMVEVLADQPIASVAFTLPDGQPAQPAPARSPFPIVIDPLLLTPGANTFAVQVTDADGDSSEASFIIEVDPSIGLTQTQTALPSPTVTPSATVTFTASPTFTPSATATPLPSLTPTITLTPSLTPDLRATAEALSVTQTSIAFEATAAEIGTRDSQAALLGTQVAITQSAGTRIAANVGATATAVENRSATQSAVTAAAAAAGTQAAGASATSVQATAFSQATDVVATQAQATAYSQATNAVATQAQATVFGQATAASIQATATSVRATANAQATATSVAATATSAQATAFSQATATSIQATAFSQATATSAQATAFSQATATSAQATVFSQATATSLQATIDALTTQSALQTQAAATDIALAATLQAQQRAEETRVVVVATNTAIANETAVAAVLATQAFEQTQIAAQTGTAVAQTQAAATQNAAATGTMRAAQSTARVLATQAAALDATQAQATARILTLTPPATPSLIEQSAESPPVSTDLLPLVCIAGVIALALVFVFILLSGRGRRRERD